VEVHIKMAQNHKKQSVTPYCAKQHKPKGRKPTTKEIRAYTRGRQAHNQGKSTSTLGDTIVDHVTMITRGDPPKMGPKGPSRSAATLPLGPFGLKLHGPPLTASPMTVQLVKAANSKLRWCVPSM
jgi:hypothetical protein